MSEPLEGAFEPSADAPITAIGPAVGFPETDHTAQLTGRPVDEILVDDGVDDAEPVDEALDDAFDVGSIATDAAAIVLSASRNTAVGTNAASGNPANAAARSIRSRSLVDRRRSRRAAAAIEKLQLEVCTVLYRTAYIAPREYEFVT